MAQTNAERSEMNARIVYWGIDGAGKSTNLRSIHAKLRPDHRGALRQLPTRLDPTVTYEVLPIELGELGGMRTRLQIVAVPGAPEHTPTRKQLLDRVDGIVFVIDATPGRLDENIASFEELRSSLAAYGRSLEDVPLVLQHNKEDRADPYALEELHRKLDVQGAAVFVSVASEGTGVLQTLTTISKRVIRTLREQPPARATRAEPAPPAARPEPAPAASAPTFEEAALAITEEEDGDRIADLANDTQGVFQGSWEETIQDAHAIAPAEWRVATVGRAQVVGPRSVRLPLVLCDDEGHELRFELSLSLAAVTGGGGRGGGD